MHTSKPSPGKYEGNRSQLVARVIDNLVGNGFADAELGDVDTFGYYAMVVGKRNTYLLSQDSQGFVFVDYGDHQTCKERWAEIEAEYQDTVKQEG